MTTTTTLLEESQRQGGFYVPRFEVKVEGVDLPRDVLFDVSSVIYEDSVESIDSFRMTINNWDDSRREYKFIGSETAEQLEAGHRDQPRVTLFEPCGKEVLLQMGYGSQLVTMLRGHFTTMQPTYVDGKAELTVTGLNVLHQLRRTQYTTSWTDKRDSEIAQDIGGRTDHGRRRFPLPIVIDEQALGTEKPIPLVTQHNQYDIDFLFQRARMRGYVMFIQEEDTATGRPRQLYFGPSQAGMVPGLRDVSFELKWGASLMEFKTDDHDRQPGLVGHRARLAPDPPGTDHAHRHPRRRAHHREPRPPPHPERVRGARGARRRRADLHELRGARARDRDPARPDEADRHRRREGRRPPRPARGAARGDHQPRRAPERQVLRHEDVPLDRRRRLRDDVQLPARADTKEGEHRDQGPRRRRRHRDGGRRSRRPSARSRSEFPWLADDATSGWVPIARPMAGKERGFYFMPEVDDEVLVAFEHGNVDHPFVIGFLHNGVDVPPDDDIDTKVRRIKTVSGHVLDFDDRSGKERVILTTQGGHHLEHGRRGRRDRDQDHGRADDPDEGHARRRSSCRRSRGRRSRSTICRARSRSRRSAASA